jgi:L-serine deaminase
LSGWTMTARRSALRASRCRREECDQARQHENMRQQSTTLLLAVSAALATVGGTALAATAGSCRRAKSGQHSAQHPYPRRQAAGRTGLGA